MYCGDSVNFRPLFSSSFRNLSNFPFGGASSKFCTSMIPASRHLCANICYDKFVNISILILHRMVDSKKKLYHLHDRSWCKLTYHMAYEVVLQSTILQCSIQAQFVQCNVGFWLLGLSWFFPKPICKNLNKIFENWLVVIRSQDNIPVPKTSPRYIQVIAIRSIGNSHHFQITWISVVHISYTFVGLSTVHKHFIKRTAFNSHLFSHYFHRKCLLFHK